MADDVRGTRSSSKEGDVITITAELADIIVQPFHRFSLITETYVPY